MFFETENLTVGYGKKPLIRDICLSLKRGEILTLIGPNGSGKTTILKSIVSVLQPLYGAVYIASKPVLTMQKSDLAKQAACMFTQNKHDELMTVFDVVAAGRYPYTGRFGILSEDDKKAVHEAMVLTETEGISDCLFSNISDGQRQRAVLARALCQEPTLLILDEPTSFLDIKYKLSFLSLVQRLARKKQIAVILSLHELDLAERISDKIACVKGDKIAYYGPTEDIFIGNLISELYDIKTGFYSPLNGQIELQKPDGKPEIFVIGGGGYGSPVYRRLQRMGIPFCTGILWENDVDYVTATALASEIVSVNPFSFIDDKCLQSAKKFVDNAKFTVCTLPENRLTGIAEPLKNLCDYAASLKKLSNINEIYKNKVDFIE